MRRRVPDALVHDGIGIWLAARRLHQGRFTWPSGGCGALQFLTREQLDALVLGLPWHRIGEAGVIGLPEPQSNRCVRRWSACLVARTLASMPADLPISAGELAALQAAGLGEIGANLLRRIEHDRQEIDRRDVKLERLSFEIAQDDSRHGLAEALHDLKSGAVFAKILLFAIAPLSAMILEVIREQVETLRRPLAAVSLTTLPRKSSPLLLLLHWHGFLPQGRTLGTSSPPSHRQAPLPSSAVQLTQPWNGLHQVDSQMLAVAWRMGAWDMTREHRRGCSVVGASMREAVECRQAFGDNPLAPDDETHLVAEAPDRIEMRDLASRLGYIRWLFRPVAEGLWRGAGEDDSLLPDGSRELPCPIEPHQGSIGTDSRHRYQLGRVDHILVL